MIKNYYLLLLLVVISIIDCSKISSKNLRSLDETKISATLSEATQLKNVNGKLTFGITSNPSTDLVSGNNYILKILVDNTGEKDATCAYDGTKLNCEYNYGKPYYGPIKIPKKTISLEENVKSLEISQELTLQQTVELTYDKSYVKFTDTNTDYDIYDLQVYIKETEIEANAFYQVDIKWNKQVQVANCTYTITTSSPPEKYLSCIYRGNYKNLIRLIKTQTNGSIKWKNEDTADFEKTSLLKLEVTDIYPYTLYFENKQWKFHIHAKTINVEAEGYYYTINVLINKADNTNDIPSTALCRTINYHSECTIEANLDESELAQEPNYLFYLSNTQTGASIILKDNCLANKKIIPRVKTLTFKRAYELKYDIDYYWKFKIDIADDNLRDGLNVTVDLYYKLGNPKFYTASCIHRQKTLSCTRDTVTGSYDLLELYIQKQSGTVTWSNANSLAETIKIPLEIELTHKSSYYLKYDSENNKWTFKIDVQYSKTMPADSLFIVDILYGSNEKTTAECGGNNKTTSSSNEKTTLSCECALSSTETPKLSNTKISGSVTWTGLSNPVIDRKLEFNFIRAYNLEYIPSSKKLFFEIEFENTEDLSLVSTKEYSVDMSYRQSSAATADYFIRIAKCSPKKDFTNIFSCFTVDTYTPDNMSKYSFYMRPTYHVTPDTIIWKDGITGNIAIEKKPKLTFVKGTYKYESNTWILNLDVTGMSTDIQVNSKIYVDLAGITYKTLECTVSSNMLLKCDTRISSSSPGALDSYALKNSTIGTSGLTWENPLEELDSSLFYLEATLVYKSNGELTFKNNKWQFNLLTSAFPESTKIIIDIIYGGVASTATCIKDNSITTCIVDDDSQSSSPIEIKISKDKEGQSTITWSGLTEDQVITSNPIDDTKRLTFNKVYDLTLNGDVWEFKILLSDGNLEDFESIQIDIKFNDVIKTTQCKYTLDTKVLKCERAKSTSQDIIILINRNENKKLVWTNLNSEIPLYVSLNIEFINYYGGFYENKWKFNLKYENNERDPSNFNGYNTLLDIKVNNNANKALCTITDKFLLCESQHSSQAESDRITIYKGTPNLGTITISNDISTNKRTLKPIDITLESYEIADLVIATNSIEFTIEGDLKESDEIAENTISEVQILVKKKSEDKVLNALCLTNEINNSPVILSCKATETANKAEDDVFIKVDSNGKSNYVTFYSIKDNIEVFHHTGESGSNPGTNQGESKTPNADKSNGFKLKINNLLLISLIVFL